MKKQIKKNKSIIKIFNKIKKNNLKIKKNKFLKKSKIK